MRIPAGAAVEQGAVPVAIPPAAKWIPDETKADAAG